MRSPVVQIDMQNAAAAAVVDCELCQDGIVVVNAQRR
jgi:hypothetical protein